MAKWVFLYCYQIYVGWTNYKFDSIKISRVIFYRGFISLDSIRIFMNFFQIHRNFSYSFQKLEFNEINSKKNFSIYFLDFMFIVKLKMKRTGNVVFLWNGQSVSLLL